MHAHRRYDIYGDDAALQAHLGDGVSSSSKE